jgi:hypothetical protein
MSQNLNTYQIMRSLVKYANKFPEGASSGKKTGMEAGVCRHPLPLPSGGETLADTFVHAIMLPICQFVVL